VEVTSGEGSMKGDVKGKVFSLDSEGGFFLSTSSPCDS